MSEKTQYFMGYRFTRGEEGTYYRCAKLKKRMHCFVWEYYNGPIPKGYEVHHKDFDKSNNDISNLQLLTRAEHRKLHADLLTDDERNWRRENMNENARPKAIEWHKSTAGSDWHSEHIKQQRQNGAFKQNLVCTNCGKTFVGEKRLNNFCSNKCKSQYRRKSGVDLVERTCPVCGNVFKTNKYGHTITCSRSCTNRYRSKCEDKINKENN